MAPMDGLVASKRSARLGVSNTILGTKSYRFGKRASINCFTAEAYRFVCGPEPWTISADLGGPACEGQARHR